MERISFSDKYCSSCTDSRPCSMHLAIYPPPISPTTSSRSRGESNPSIKIIQANSNNNNNFILSPTTEGFPPFSSSPPTFPPPVPLHSSNVSAIYAPSNSSTRGRSFSNDSTVDMMYNSSSHHSGRKESRSNSSFSLSGSSGYGSPEMRPFAVIPTTSISERTNATNNNAIQDPRPIFPPNEETIQETYNQLRSTESKTKIIHSGDLSYKPDPGINLLNRRPHFILTNNNLLVYRSAQKAKSELSIPIEPGQVIAPSRFNKERVFLASLSDIYAIHTVVSPPFTFRIDYLHPRSKQSLFYTMTAESNSEVRKWVKELRKAVRVHLLRMELINASERYSVVERISKHNDTPSKTDNILMYKVVYKEKRFVVSGDQPKEIFLPVIFAIGKFSFYILPVPGYDSDYKKYMQRERYGLLSIQSLRYESHDDTVVAELRNVDKPVSQLVFASSFCEEIIQHLRRSILSIIPNNTVPIHYLVVPKQLERTRIMPFHVEMDPEDEMVAPADVEIQLFHSNLRAYCASLNLNKTRFRFIIVGPHRSKSFTLLPPKEIRDYPATYTKYELLAILRAIQVSTFFAEINLTNMSLLELESWKKTKEDGWTTIKGHPFDDPNVLSNEIYGILTNTSILRKLNLTNCKIGKHEEQDKKSAITAIGLIMASGKTSISRLCLGKNFVSQSDAFQLVEGIKRHKKSMKELYLNDCGLETNMIETILETLSERSPEQLVCLDLSTSSENLVVKKDLISTLIETFRRIKVLRMRGFRLLSNSFTFNLEGSHLKEIDLGNCRMDDVAIHRLCRWILSPSFGTVEALHLGKCGLNGAHVHDILTSITRTQNRVMFLNLESNPIMKESMHLPKLFSAIRQSEGPAYISLAKLDWDDSTLCELFESLRDNTMFKFLDLSDISLQYSEKVSEHTVQMMTSFFERNKTVQELKLNYELLKPGRVVFSTKPRPVIADTITASLRGLRNNTTLEKLDLTGLGIEDPGAFAFAQVLKVNRGIKSILIDENNISIDGYRKIANSIEDFAHQVVEIHAPRTDMRNQLKHLEFRIEELIVSEHESQFFIMHTTNSESRREKRHHLQMLIQEREKCQLSLKHFDGVVQYLLNVVEKNRRAKEEIFNRNMEVQLQAQVQAQELAINQRRKNSRPNTNSFQNDTFGVGVVPESSQTHDGSASSTTGSQSSSVISDRTKHLTSRTSAVDFGKYHPYSTLSSGHIYSGSISSMSHDSHIYDAYSKPDLNKPKSNGHYSIYSDISPLKSSIYPPPTTASRNDTGIIDDPGFMSDFGYIDDLDFDIDSYRDLNQLSMNDEAFANEETVIQDLHRSIYQLA